ncbi:hypothetical protein [Streptomyces sp. CA-111067]|uniref:hypothetical protein n=1 Tax=Streptomyces sp. CA-111067 TaxID=3240046 RepID=UPI003D9628BE
MSRARLRVSWGPDRHPHFLLTEKDAVSLDVFQDPGAKPDWWNPGTGLASLNTGPPGPTNETFDVPTGVPLRLQFALRPGPQGKPTAVGLEVVQLLRVSDKGTVTFDEFAVRRGRFVMKPQGGATLPGRRPVAEIPDVMEVQGGQHPLLETGPGASQLRISTDFVDITALWWDLHHRETSFADAEQGRWEFDPKYLDPACDGDPEGLRVLASTWGVPLLWFAAVPRSARGPLRAGTRVGGSVFFRPLHSAYAYDSATFTGIIDPRHRTEGMASLARYLLTGRSRGQERSISHYKGNHFASLLDREWLPPPAKGQELLPPSARMVNLPIGMERQLDLVARRTKDADPPAVRVLLLPWPGALGTSAAYTHALKPGLAAHAKRALALLWCTGAIGGPGQPLTTRAIAPPSAAGSSAPLTLDPLLWVGGYSRGGEAANLALAANAESVSRLISMDDPTVANHRKELVEAAAKARKAGRRLQVLLVKSPHTGGLPRALLDALTAAKADLVTLPDPAGFARFWARPPFTGPSWQRYLLSDWDARADAVAADVKSEREKAAKDRGHDDQYGVFQHVVAVVGGDVFKDEPQGAGSRGFVEQCFGPWP